MMKLKYSFGFAAALALTACAGSNDPDHADMIISGGQILTMEGATPEYIEAVGIADGEIVYAGSLAGADDLRGPQTIAKDLQGNVLLPAFVDAHSHYINTLSVANQAKLYPAPAGPGNSVEAIIQELVAFVDTQQIEPGELIMGYGYDDTVMPDGRLLTRDDLDEAFPNNPVRIDHISMHGAVLNSAAIEYYDLDPKMPTPPGGVVVRKPGTNEIGGLIMEAAFLPVFEQSPKMTPEEEIANTRAAQMMYAEAGITTAQEGATHTAQLQTMMRAASADAHIIDVAAYPFVTDLEKILDVYPRDQWLQYSNGLKIAGVKITIDGSPQGKTAAFTTPYLVNGPGGEKNWKGELIAPQSVINDALQQVLELSVPVLFHVNGDAAIDSLIEAYEFSTGEEATRDDHNLTAIHAQFIRQDQIDKFVQYDIRPSFYTLHTYYFADAHRRQRGPDQTAFTSPMRAAIDAGLRPTNHTDAVVVPLDQMFMLWSAVNRISRSGEIIGADQRISPYEGLKAMTLWSAEQLDEGAKKGSISVGKLADLVVLDADPTKVEAEKIKDIAVLETMKAGTTIYTAQ